MLLFAWPEILIRIRLLQLSENIFGSWKRNDNLKLLKFKDEQPIAKHIEKTVYGQESPLIYVGWRFPSAYRDGRTLSNIGDTLYMVSNILNNRGDAGLIDMNVNRPQKGA